MRFFKWLFLPFLLTAAGCRSTVPAIPAVSGFEVDKYLGKWYEICRLPNWFEKDMRGVSAEYFRSPDGSLRVINRGLKNGIPESVNGFIRFSGSSSTGELQVSFFRPFYADYRIIKLAPDYRYSVVTSRDGTLLWVLSRTVQLAGSDQADIMDFLRKHAFPVEKLIPGQ